MNAIAEELTRAFNPAGSIPLVVAAIRLTAAMVLGGIIGWEREVHSRAAGLRTHIMISLAAAVFAVLAVELVHFPSAPGVMMRVDPLRLIESVTSGVAFLAAGSIVVSGFSVRGITTGASMWLCGAIGLACGVGNISLALLTTALAMTVLWLIHRILSPLARRLKKPDNPPEQRKD
ncbi:MgtC/SapB family protein [Paracoccus alkenifer]|uniref:Protein MgtC n=1 Tax=Paracoccus alkenifer TaxID=65735 RepID=A0A1H6JQ41_9RHOB|nr:MgtC/SapB family protein [Paracoccus alkenifer]SEH61930.1 putative Mg2+ transporter-C (MgtC) family protein [Paracoccus alkenifer]